MNIPRLLEKYIISNNQRIIFSTHNFGLYTQTVYFFKLPTILKSQNFYHNIVRVISFYQLHGISCFHLFN